jgi:hypothetical protein
MSGFTPLLFLGNLFLRNFLAIIIRPVRESILRKEILAWNLKFEVKSQISGQAGITPNTLSNIDIHREMTLYGEPSYPTII